jgi:small subunit ribosomal protein S8
MIIRVQNGYMARRDEVLVPHSKVKEAIAELLKREHYVEDVTIQDEKPQKVMTLKLLYVNGMPAVTR